jgi:hypothetical protein
MPPRKSRIPRVNRQRKSKNWTRAYGSVERVLFVRSLPCVMCGAVPSENAHIETGGMGRKADYTKIVPLCKSGHDAFHVYGRDYFKHRSYLDLEAAAAETEARWRAHLAEDAA